MQSAKALAAMLAAVIAGMTVATFLLGCRPAARPPAANGTAQGNASNGTKASDEKSREEIAAARKVGKGNPVLEEGDWNQWGGNGLRNNVPVTSGMPTLWSPGEFDRRTGKWDASKAKNIKWFASLGSQTYGNTVVASGRAFVGTNNSGG